MKCLNEEEDRISSQVLEKTTYKYGGHDYVVNGKEAEELLRQAHFSGGQGEMVVQLSIASNEDIVLARQKARDIAAETGFSLRDQTRIVTVVSELARNIVIHAQSGKMTVYKPAQREGLEIVFQDKGPGIADLGKAIADCHSSVASPRLGLQSAKRLSDAMEITSQPGQGTTITILKWL